MPTLNPIICKAQKESIAGEINLSFWKHENPSPQLSISPSMLTYLPYTAVVYSN